MKQEYEKGKYGVKTVDLYIIPQTRDELKELIDKEADETVKSEYAEALKACEEDPDNGVFHTYWKAVRRKGDKKVHVGGFYFTGVPERGATGVKFRIFDEYKGHRYATQGLRALTDWAFYQKNVYVIKAEVGAENDSAISVLDRAGFVYRSGDRETQEYSIEKPGTSWSGLYLCIGIACGFLIGFVFSSMAIGMAVSIIASLAIGSSLDISAEKTRESVTGEKRSFFRKAKKEK